jgi:hypothetical protein
MFSRSPGEGTRAYKVVGCRPRAPTRRVEIHPVRVGGTPRGQIVLETVREISFSLLRSPVKCPA